jgi:ATP/maltotriose-dependent transcriptional regulator MalT
MLVDRSHLFSQMFTSPVTALIAPVGSGKSMLAMQWATAFKGAVCWITLTEEDDRPRVFWSFALNLLRLVAPERFELSALLLAQEGERVSERFVDMLISEIATLAFPIAFVIDEAHILQDPVLVQSLAHFLNRRTGHVRVVFVGRSLALPLLAQAHVESDLSFSYDEAAQILTAQSENPPDKVAIANIVSATEGWVMGVKLAGIALRRSSTTLKQVASYSARYLFDEALRHLPFDQLDFMQRTCVCDLLIPALCDEITGRNDSMAQMETLMIAGVFITRVSEEPPTYRAHALLREALLERAQANNPNLLRESHRRAAKWYARSEQYRNAAEHASGSGDIHLTAEYALEAFKNAIVDNDPLATRKWLENFPPEVLDVYPRLHLFAIISQSNAGESLSMMQAHLQRLQEHPDVAKLHGEIALAKSYLNQSEMNFPSALVHMEEALTHLQKDALYAYAMGVASLLYILTGQPDKGRAMINEEYRVAHEIGSTPTILHALISQVYFHLADGDFVQVLKMASEGIALIQKVRGALGRWALDAERTFRYEAGMALMCRGELVEADQMLRPAFVQIEWMDATILSMLYCLRGNIATLRRDESTANATFANAVLLRGGDQRAGDFNIPIQLERMRIVLRYHRPKDARLWLENRPQGDIPWEMAASEMIITTHARMVVGDTAQVLETLEHLEKDFAARGQQILVANTLGLKVLAHWLMGDEAAARTVLDQAITHTLPAGNVLPLALLPLIPLLRQRVYEFWEAGEDDHADHLRRVILLMGEEAPVMPLKPLTDVERKLALLMLADATSYDIAELLFMTDRGVRYHISNLHHKLLTHTRQQMIERLRKIDLSE